MTRIDELKGQLAELDKLISSGTLKGKAARKSRDDLEARIVAAVLQSEAATDAGAANSAAGQRPSSRLVLGLGAFVLLFAAAGYAWLGNREGLAVAPGAPGAPAATQAEAAPHDMGPAQMEALAQRLADRLKDKPDDADGWTMLGRSYSMLGRHQEALQAYQKVVALRPKEAQAYADSADALAMVNGRKLDGEPEKLIARALQLDPNHTKALSLAGTLAYERGDAALAARHWEKALAGVEPGSELAGRLQGAVNEARQKAGLPALPDAPGAAPAPGPAMAAAAQAKAPPARAGAPGTVQLRISLAPELAAKAAPDDTLFIFARPVEGSKAPLAIQRRQVRDLPLEVVLDDSMAMSPAMALSTVKQVVVGARISKSGSAMGQKGDMQALSAPLAVGSRDVKLLINEVVP